MFDFECFIYCLMVVYGYFGCDEFLWEVIDKVEVLKVLI